MRDIQIQAARDALAELGGPVQFTSGEYSEEISALIRPDVTDFDELGNMVVMTTLRAVSVVWVPDPHSRMRVASFINSWQRLNTMVLPGFAE